MLTYRAIFENGWRELERREGISAPKDPLRWAYYPRAGVDTAPIALLSGLDGRPALAAAGVLPVSTFLYVDQSYDVRPGDDRWIEEDVIRARPQKATLLPPWLGFNDGTTTVETVLSQEVESRSHAWVLGVRVSQGHPKRDAHAVVLMLRAGGAGGDGAVSALNKEGLPPTLWVCIADECMWEERGCNVAEHQACVMDGEVARFWLCDHLPPSMYDSWNKRGADNRFVVVGPGAGREGGSEGFGGRVAPPPPEEPGPSTKWRDLGEVARVGRYRLGKQGLGCLRIIQRTE